MRLGMPHSYSQEQVHGLEKSAYLAIDPMTIWEGRWAIAQAIMDCWVKTRGPGHPHVNLLAQQPFRFDPLWGMPLGTSNLVAPIINHHHISSWEAENAIRHRQGPKASITLVPLASAQIVVRVTGFHYQWLPWCHLGLTGQMDPDIPEEGDSTKRRELTWR